MSDIIERLGNSLLRGDHPDFYMLRNADIAEAKGEIGRLRADIRVVKEELCGEQMLTSGYQAEGKRLRAALRSAACPGGGFNGMPKDAEPTVELCVTHGVCGCDLGRALEDKA